MALREIHFLGARYAERASACNVVIQSLPDLRAGIAFNAGKNVDGLAQSQIAMGRRVLFRIYQIVHFAVTGMESIIVNLIIFRLMGGFANRSAAVKALHASYLYPVYEARRKPGAEAVIDIDYRHAGGAGVEHAEQRRQSVETGAVTDAGGHGDDRLID